MARVPLPESRVRRLRRRRRIVIASLFFGCVVVIMGLAIWFTWWPFLQVTAIEVSGTETLATSSVSAIAERDLAGKYYLLFSRRNIFIYSKSLMSRDIVAAFPTIAQVEVHAKNFHTITIAVLERQPTALWCPDTVASVVASTSAADATGCLLMDQDGIAYTQASGTSMLLHYSGALAGAALPEQYLSVAQFRSLAALINAFAQNLKSETVSEIMVDANTDVYLRFTDGFEIIFPLNADGGDVYDRFTLALQSDPFKQHPLSAFEYLDLRFGDKLYYKLK